MSEEKEIIYGFEKNPNMNGAPRKELSDEDFDKIDGMIQIQCTAAEIASVMDMNTDTLDSRLKEKYGYGFSERFALKSGSGRMSLRRRQFKKAIEEGDTKMMIHLGKQYLGQTDKSEVVQSSSLSIEMSRDEKLEMVDKYKDKILKEKDEDSISGQ